MPFLMNLLPYRPVATGLSRYTERLLDGWIHTINDSAPLQLRIDDSGNAELSRDITLPKVQKSPRMRWLQRNGLVQHGTSVRDLVSHVDADIIYSPYTDFIMELHNKPQIITCHDLIPLYFPGSKRAYFRSKFLLPLHLHRAAKIVAISKSVAEILISQGFPSARIEVIPNGIEQVDDPICSPTTQDMLLLARHGRNKNIPLALQGFAHFCRNNTDWTGKLCIVGHHTPATNKLFALSRDLCIDHKVIWIEHLAPFQLEECIRRSFCLLSTSFMEGFDYPVFEAQARGVPTLLSRIPVHDELHQNNALFFDLDDNGTSLAGVMLELARDSYLWRHLSLTGLSHARNFSIQRQISSLKCLIQQVAGTAH